jgi:hypothetical protein
MSTFLDQFSKLHDNSSTIYLKRIFFDQNILGEITLTREINNIQEDADKTFLYDTGEEMFLFISYKEFPNNKKIEFIDRKKYLQSSQITTITERPLNQSPLMFYEEHHDFNTEYTVTLNWLQDDKLMIQYEYVIMLYGDVEKTVLKKYSKKQINSKLPSEVSKSFENITKVWANSSSKITRKNDLPAEIVYSKNGKLLSEKWYFNNTLHRLTGPAIKIYDILNRIKRESWYLKDIRNNIVGPSEIFYRYSDRKKVKVWFDNDAFVRSIEEDL